MMHESQEPSHEDSILHWLVHRHAAIAGYSNTDARENFPANVAEDERDGLQRIDHCLQILEEMRQERTGNCRDVGPDDSQHIGMRKRIGRFELEKELGRGGAGVVFLAFDPNLCRNVALKVPHFDAVISPEMRRRFINEGEAAARLNHPNVVSVYEVGEQGPLVYLAAEYFPGANMAQWLRDQTEHVDVRDTAALFLQIAEGVSHAHSRGVLHRDLKPSNVLLVENSDGLENLPATTAAHTRLVPKITDFGLAKLVEREDNATRTGMMLGTVEYMAPEQSEGRVRDIGVQSDIFSIGVMLYEVLSGEHPFRGETERATANRIQCQSPRSLRGIRREIPPDLEAICLKCLEKNPQHRYQTASELGADLSRFLNHAPTLARPVGAIERIMKWAVRRPVVAGASMLAVIASAIFVAVILILSESRGRALDRAERNELAIRQQLYASEMKEAMDAYQNGDIPRVRDLLAGQVPEDGGVDFRGWEWSLLDNEAHRETLELSEPETAVFSIAISPDGQLLASGDEGSYVHVWDFNSGSLKRRLDTDQIEVNSVAFSPDGRLLASAGKDTTVRLWDIETGEPVGDPLTHEAEVYCVAFSPDGKWLATGGRDNVLRKWTIGEDRPSNSWPHADEIEDLCIDSGGESIATAGHDAVVRLLSVDNQDVVWEWKWEPDPGDDRIPPISCVRFAPDGEQLVVCRNRRNLAVLDAQDGRVFQILDDIEGEVATAEFTPDGANLILGCRDGSIELRPAPAGILVRCNVTFIDDFDISTDKDLVAVIQDAGHLAVHRLSDGALYTYPAGYVKGSPAVAIAPDSQTFATAGFELRRFKVWPTVTLGKIRLFEKGYPGRHIEYSHDGAHLAVGLNIGKCELYASEDYPEGDPQITLQHTNPGTKKPDGSPIRGCQFSPDDSLIATCSENDLVALWETETGNLVHEFNDHRNDALCVRFSPDGSLLASGSSDGMVLLFDVAQRCLLYVLDSHSGEIWALDFAADGKTLYTSGKDGTICRWSTETGLQVGQPWRTGKRVNWLEWYDQEQFAWCADQYCVATQSTAAIKERRTLSAHAGKVRSIAVHPDGNRFVSAGGDATIRHWDIHNSGRFHRQLLLGKRNPAAVSISPDGRWVTSRCDYTGRLELREVSDGSLLHIVSESIDKTPVVGWSSDSETIAVANESMVQVISVVEGDERFRLTGHSGNVTDIAFAASGDIIATSSLDRTIRLWSASDGSPLAEWQGHNRSCDRVTLSPDGTTLASSGGDRKIVVWDTNTKSRLSEMVGHTAAITAIEFSPDGNLIASCAGDGTVRLWETATGTQMHSFPQSGNAQSLVFSTNGRTLASGGVATELSLWHVTTGRRLGSLFDDSHQTWSIQFDDADNLFFVDRDQHEQTTLLIWRTK